MLGHSLNNLEHQDFGYQVLGCVLVASKLLRFVSFR
jgi:hypothetical protein